MQRVLYSYVNNDDRIVIIIVIPMKVTAPMIVADAKLVFDLNAFVSSCDDNDDNDDNDDDDDNDNDNDDEAISRSNDDVTYSCY